MQKVLNRTFLTGEEATFYFHVLPVGLGLENIHGCGWKIIESDLDPLVALPHFYKPNGLYVVKRTWRARY